MVKSSGISALVGVLALAWLEAVAQPVGSCRAGGAWADLDVNGVTARIYNTGGLFWNGGGPHYNVPVGTASNALFAASIWMGGLVDGELHMVAADYGPWELWPGPIEDANNPPTDCSEYDRIFKVSRYDLRNFEDTGKATPDMLDWPWQLGAPVEDGDGITENYDLQAGDRPKVIGDQTLWWVSNDVGNRHAWSLTPPMGIEVRVTAFAASSSDDAINFTTFYQYELVNKSGKDIEQTYFGIWSDPDLGNATDDYIGSDTTYGIAYAWNGDDFDEDWPGYESGYGDRPPAIGFTVVDGPNVDGQSLGMTSFLYYISASTIDGNPYGGEEAYRYLQMRWRDGRRVTYGGGGLGFSETPVDFMFAGRPPAFWSEEDVDNQGTRNTPADRRMLWSTGPFDLPAGGSQRIVVALVWVQGDDRFDSVYKLIDSVPTVRQAYTDGLPGYQGLQPSNRPALLSPADGVASQPTDVTFDWEEVPWADRYEFELSSRDSVVYQRTLGRRSFPSSSSESVVSHTVELPEGSEFSWRVRGLNATGFGPWSRARTFLSTGASLVWRRPLYIDESDTPAFIQVAGIGDDDACGPTAGSTYGCTEVGGNNVYGSYNGQEDWIMYNSGSGPEFSIGAFAPHDFEVRATERGSYGYFGLTSGNAIWVPLEVWDVGDVGPFGVNDTRDDVQLVPILFADNGGDCEFGFGEIEEDPFGIGWPGTDRVYAYYPVNDDYASWEAAVRSLVDADPKRCPTSPETDDASALIDFDRGRPLQRLVWYMDPNDPDYRPEFIPVGNVIRFLTTRPVPPVLSAPANGEIVSSDARLYWQLPPDWDSSRVQIFLYGDPSIQVLDTLVAGHTLTLTSQVPGVYLWRTSYGDENWSDMWSYIVVPGTSSENDGSGLPTKLELRPAYPNPFSVQTTLLVGLPQSGRISVSVYDPLGRRVETISDGEQRAGWHSLRWAPEGISSGVYFVVLESGNQRLTKPVVLAR